MSGAGEERAAGSGAAMALHKTATYGSKAICRTLSQGWYTGGPLLSVQEEYPQLALALCVTTFTVYVSLLWCVLPSLSV